MVVAEVRGKPPKAARQEMLTAIQSAVSLSQQLSCYAVLLLKERSVPKTTSGKIQRKRCK